jgi:hypothetical protein
MVYCIYIDSENCFSGIKNDAYSGTGEVGKIISYKRRKLTIEVLRTCT